jgi:hypothetical protein
MKQGGKIECITHLQFALPRIASVLSLIKSREPQPSSIHELDPVVQLMAKYVLPSTSTAEGERIYNPK